MRRHWTGPFGRGYSLQSPHFAINGGNYGCLSIICKVDCRRAHTAFPGIILRKCEHIYSITFPITGEDWCSQYSVILGWPSAGKTGKVLGSRVSMGKCLKMFGTGVSYPESDRGGFKSAEVCYVKSCFSFQLCS